MGIDADQLVFRSWRNGMAIGATLIALRKAGMPQKFEQVRRAFAHFAERFS